MLSLKQVLSNESRDAIETYCRMRAQSAYCGKHLAVCRVLGEIMMYVNTRDISIAPHLMLDGCWEMWTTMAIGRYIQPGMQCIDVGACLGYFTLLMSRLGAYCSAFEPNPIARWLLMRNLEKAGLSVHRVYEYAASDRTGECMLNVSRNNYCNSELVENQPIRQPKTMRERIINIDLDPHLRKVKTLPLDSVLEGPIDLIKIDVEGHEARVFAGMRKIIEASPALRIVMEVNAGDEALDLLMKDIRTFDFKIHVITPNGDLEPRSDLGFMGSPGPRSAMLWLER